MLHIRNIRLVNWTGVHAGTGRDEISIEFPDPSTLPSRIVLFMGENGSGKSTVLSAMHPFAASFDGREESQVRDGTEGLKEIEIVRGDDVFRAIHRIDRRKAAVKTRSFLERNGVVLNENGLVGSFHDALLDQLGLEESFFRVGRVVNSGSTNFVDLTAGLRKDFIASQLPDLQPWMAAFKEAARKCLESERTLKYLGDEIGRLPDRAQLEADRGQAERILKAATKVHSGAEKAKGAIESEVEKLEDSKEVSEANRMNDAVSDATETVVLASTEVERIVRQWNAFGGYSTDDARAKIEDGVRKAEECRGLVEGSSKKEADLKTNTLRIRNQITAKNEELAKYSDIDGVDKDELAEMIVKRSKNVKLLKKNVRILRKSLGKKAVTLGEGLTVKSMGRLEAAHRALGEKITTLFEELALAPAGALLTAEAAGMGGQPTRSLAIRSDHARNQIDEVEEKIASLRGAAAAAEMLKQRPKACKIESCHFVKEGRKGADAEARIIELSAFLVELGIERDMYLSASNLKRRKFLINDCLNDDDVFGPLLQAISGLELDGDDPAATVLETGQLDALAAFDPKDMLSLVENRAELVGEEEQLMSDSDRLELLEASGDMIGRTRRDLAALETEQGQVAGLLQDLSSESVSLRRNKMDVDDALAALRRYLEALEALGVAETESNKLGAEAKKSRKSLTMLSKMRSELLERKTEADEAMNTMEAARKSSETVATRIAKLDEYEERRDEFTATYAKQNEVRLTCDPKKGLPLAFMQEFLEGTKEMANGLFDMAFRGKFRVDFVVTDKEFRIQVEKDDGDVLSDVKLASDGERAFIKTIISLSLLSCYAGAFPVLSLDEVDAVLDAEHRTSFADIIEGQISQLNLGQVFAISHNDEFRNENVSVVLFPGHTLGSGDRNLVIADFGERRRN